MNKKEMKFSLSNMREITQEEFFSITPRSRENMCRNQILIDITSGGVKTTLNVLKWWCNENCNSMVFVLDEVFYFECEADATAFKIRWS